MKRTKIVLAILLINASLMAQSVVSGYVFEDLNNNGRKDGREKGLANVAVSDGKNVVITNDKGRYELKTGNDNIIFVIKPEGYKFPVNQYNLAQFYKIHKPSGAPKLHFETVNPTGKLPSSVDFALNKTTESTEFTAVIFGDPQPYDTNHVNYFRKAIVDDIKAFGTRNALFGISLGDIVGDDLTLHNPYKQTVKEIGLPWYNVMGNHDMNYDVKSDTLSDATFEAHFGPNNYAFNVGKAHFIVLDDILYPDPRDGKGYWGGFRNDQLEFVKNDLNHVPTDNLIVISLHIPLEDKESGTEAFRQADRIQLYKLLDNYENVLILSAHTHIQYQAFTSSSLGLNRKKPIHEFNAGATCGDWYSGIINENNLPVTTMRDGTEQGYSFLHVKENQYTLNYKVSGKPSDYQMALHLPKVVPYKSYGSDYSIFANIFMATENDVVEYRIDNGEWKKMTRLEQPDPGYVRYVQDWDYLEKLVPGRRPSDPVKCFHLWQGNLSVQLEPGIHPVEVRTTDMFGRIISQKTSYRIENNQ